MGSDASGRLANGVLRQTIAQYQLDTLAFGATMARVGDEAKAGQGLGAASSIFKYYGTELNKRRNELNLAACGEAGPGLGGRGVQRRCGQPGLAALQGQLHRGRHLRGAVEHYRQARAWPAGRLSGR